MCRLMLMLMVVIVLLVGGCRTHTAPGFDTFTRNRLAVVVRSLESVRDAQTSAKDQVVKTLHAIREQAWTGAVPDEAYDTVRRMSSTCQSRVHSAEMRLNQAEFQGDDYFQQWGRELEEYEDHDLREVARKARSDFKLRFDATLKQLYEAQKAFGPVLTAIDDQDLFIKHHRGMAALPERPQPVIEPLSRADDLVNRVNLARISVDDFIAHSSIPR